MWLALAYGTLENTMQAHWKMIEKCLHVNFAFSCCTWNHETTMNSNKPAREVMCWKTKILWPTTCQPQICARVHPRPSNPSSVIPGQNSPSHLSQPRNHELTKTCLLFEAAKFWVVCYAAKTNIVIPPPPSNAYGTDREYTNYVNILILGNQFMDWLASSWAPIS